MENQIEKMADAIISYFTAKEGFLVEEKFKKMAKDDIIRYCISKYPDDDTLINMYKTYLYLKSSKQENTNLNTKQILND